MTNIYAVIFDLDGVLVHTDRYHFLAWKRVCDDEGVPFDETVNHRLRGVSRMESLDIILEKSVRTYEPGDKMKLAERKNNYYRDYLWNLTAEDAAPSVRDTLDYLRAKKVKMAIGSSSKNAPYILERLGITGLFDAVADGNAIRNSKPDPEVFLLAANQLGVEPKHCLVVEDAEAGVIAAKAGGMKVAAIGSASLGIEADYHIKEIREIIAIVTEGSCNKQT